MIVGYIGIAISLISLSLGIYNWNQTLVRLRADTKIYPALNGCWTVNTTISNRASRPITILKSYVETSNGEVLGEAEIRNASDFYVYMHNGQNVGSSKNVTTYPMQVTTYGACEVQRVVTQKPTKDSKVVIITPSRTFKFKINVPEEEQPN